MVYFDKVESFSWYLSWVIYLRINTPNKMIHQKRRQELLSRLPEDAVVIVSTNSEQKRNSGVSYPFRPDSSFWYLTGFEEPDAIAVFSKNNYTMYLLSLIHI